MYYSLSLSKFDNKIAGAEISSLCSEFNDPVTLNFGLDSIIRMARNNVTDDYKLEVNAITP